MDTKKIILIGIGAFVAYNLIVVAYAMSKPKGQLRLFAIAQLAPWLAISTGFASWILTA
jgi:hypothetical protein